jgi:hypothetical protein
MTTSFYVKTTIAVKGWCDVRQRLFAGFDTRADAKRWALHEAGLKLKQFSIGSEKGYAGILNI